jgi:hypothetical protein
MARYHRFAENESCKEILKRAKEKEGIIISGVRAFDEIYGITSKTVMFKCLPNRIPITPFDCKKPEWWDFYNDLKHDVAINLKKANLETVRDALAGAFLLNVIHEPASLRLFDYGLLKPKYRQETMFQTFYDTFREHEMFPERPKGKQIEDPFFIETPLFVYDYEKLKGS